MQPCNYCSERHLIYAEWADCRDRRTIPAQADPAVPSIDNRP